MSFSLSPSLSLPPLVSKIDSTVGELKLECWDKDLLKDEFMGQAIIPTDKLLSVEGMCQNCRTTACRPTWHECLPILSLSLSLSSLARS
jgi:hypothetical protein